MRSVDVFFQELVLIVGSFTYLSGVWSLFTYSNNEIFPIFIVVSCPTVLGVEALTSPFTLDYHTICLISVATQKLYPGVNTIALVLINVKCLLLICSIIGPAHAILSEIHKYPHRVCNHDILEINISCNWPHDS